jgi:hypothetical protein
VTPRPRGIRGGSRNEEVPLSSRPTHRRPTIGVVIAILLAVLVALAVVLFLLAQGAAAPSSPQTHGSLGPLVVTLAPALP